MMRGPRHLLVVVLVAGMWMPAGWARERVAPPEDRVDEMMTRYNLHPAFEKLGRGVANFFVGFAEVPLNIHTRYSAHDTGGSFLTGAAIGFFKGAVRTLVGAYETVTFFIPYPEDYRPILPTLEYFNRSSRKTPLPLEF